MESPTPQAEKFGKYEIICKLSRSMTDVYLARDVWTNQKLVLKRIEQSKDEFTRIAIEAETRGAQIQKQLHPHGSAYLADLRLWRFRQLLFCRDGILRGKEPRGDSAKRRAFRAAAGRSLCSRSLQPVAHAALVCDGLCGRRTAVIHGDIKPSNIQISARRAMYGCWISVFRKIFRPRRTDEAQHGKP